MGEKHSELIYYPPRFLPTDGCYFTASSDVQVAVTDCRLDTVESLDKTVSTHEFEGEIFGFEFSNRAFELSTSTLEIQRLRYSFIRSTSPIG